MSGVAVHALLGQYGTSMADLEARAHAAASSGFEGIAFLDHLWHPPPLDDTWLEAFVTATWIAARVEGVTIGHLCLCNSFRHPAVLAKQVATLDHATGGRYELGIGWGSVPEELAAFGLEPLDAGGRLDRLAETLEIVRALWSGEEVTYRGRHYRLTQARQAPVPTRRIPVTVGGGSVRTAELAAAHADWWNLRAGEVDRLPELRDRVGEVRISTTQLLAFEGTPGAEALGPNAIVGSEQALVDRLGGLRERGVERLYAMFVDRSPETIARFGETVARHLGP